MSWSSTRRESRRNGASTSSARLCQALRSGQSAEVGESIRGGFRNVLSQWR